MPRYVAHQAYYSLVGRDYEWELMPLALDQNVSAVVWSPLGWGRLTGKIRRGAAAARDQPPAGHCRSTAMGPPVDDEQLFRVVEALDAGGAGDREDACRRSRSTGCCAGRSVASVVIGARNEEQLRQNLGAVGWQLTPEQVAALDAASETQRPYPYWHQHQFVERNPGPIR